MKEPLINSLKKYIDVFGFLFFLSILFISILNYIDSNKNIYLLISIIVLTIFVILFFISIIKKKLIKKF